MLVISPAATAAIASVLSAPDVPEGSGLRLRRGGATDDGVAILVSVASRPGPEDDVLEMATGVELFVDPEARELLDDKTLDAEFDADRVVFEIRPQPVNGAGPG